MPFVEILAPPAAPSAKAEAARAVTEAITGAFGIGPETVSVYVLPVPDTDYAHAGRPGSEGATRRLFVKVHAFARDAARRRAVVGAAARPLAAAFGLPLADVAIYFLEREPDEVAHGDRLASD